MEYKRAEPKSLKSLGLDERWLQNRLAEDTALLGLGELTVVERERAQPNGGRLDFLLSDPEADGLRYTVELMCGALDESHLIRSVEYWDAERRRFPMLEHRAVIVAEDITSRFFPVLSLLSQVVPLIALEIAAIPIGDDLYVTATRILDSSGFEPTDEQDAGPQADRAYWVKRSNPVSLEVSDKFAALTPTTTGPLRQTYNQGHIALGTTGRNFVWLHPRRAHAYVTVDMRAPEDQTEALCEKLEEAGIATKVLSRGSIRYRVTPDNLGKHENVYREVLATCEEGWRH